MSKHKKTRKRIKKFIDRNGKLQKNSRHHIWPSSRSGKSDSDNIAIIDDEKHHRYHTLFINMTPPEIIHYIVNYFWNGKWEYVEQALQDHYFKGVI